MKLLIKIQYDGSCFCGYQVQPTKRTVQGELNAAAQRLYGFECNVTGCSRTDTGVHAKEFYATIEPKCGTLPSIPLVGVTKALNSFLPEDISVIESKYVDSDFHSRYDVKYKEYTYKLYESDRHDPFLRNYMLRLDKKYSDEQISLVCKACEHLVGKHDFSSFMAAGSSVKSTVRNIKYAYLIRTSDNTLEFKICADGFLYNMVRIIVGAMIDVASKKLSPDDIKTILDAKDRKKAPRTAPPIGLYLTHVSYTE